jgi:class 3 adenylate cyclase
MPDENQHPTSQRKNATVLFADLSGFTAMSANLDPEEVRDIVNRYFEALSTAVRRYEGSIDKYIGDCVMAVFGVPATHENDAERGWPCATWPPDLAVNSSLLMYTSVSIQDWW